MTKMMETCWAFQPNERPAIEDVLRCLHSGSSDTILDGNKGTVMEQSETEVKQGCRDASHDTTSAIQSVVIHWLIESRSS